MAEKAKWKRPGRKTRAAALARKESSRATSQDETNSKLRAIFNQATRGGANEPADPFLAQTAQAKPKVESVSHSSNAQQDNLPTIDRQAANFTSAAHSVDGPQQPTPEKPAPTESNVNPFVDLANSRDTLEAKSSERRPADDPFAGGIDTQLAQLRNQADGSDASNTTNALPAEQNPIRDAIFGSSADDSQATHPPLPRDVVVPVGQVDVPIEKKSNRPTEVAEDPVGRAVVQSDESADNLLPEWARESPEKSSGSVSLSAEETTSVTIPKFDLVDKAAVRPFAESITSKKIRVATNVSRVPRTAIEIVPSRVIVSPRLPSETLTNNADAAQRVELLPSPTDAVVVEERGGLTESDDSFGGMIVESDTLPSGFAEWHGNDGTHATLRTNTPLESQDVGAASNAAVPARLAAISRPIPTNPVPTETDTNRSNENPFVAQPHLLREIPSPQPVSDDLPDAVQPPPTPEALLFPSTEADEQTLESSLDSVSWDPETEPGAVAGNSLFESTAVIGLLIGLVGLVGLALIRRMHSKA